MFDILNECLKDTYERCNYVFPFLWLHGEPKDAVKEEIDAIFNCGIRAFCCESRTHESFGEDQWWEDMGFILRYAKELDMKVWLLDDKHFPTGFANGGVRKHPELRMLTLTCEFRDIVGGHKCSQIPCFIGPDEELINIVACRLRSDQTVSEPVSLTSSYNGGVLHLDLPDGMWRIFYFIRSQSRHRSIDYIDMINPYSTQLMIDEIYEPEYEHFSEYFGNTFVGFFSDEPAFHNNGMNPGGRLGHPGQNPIPWRDDIPALISEYTGVSSEQVLLDMPLLFNDGVPEETRKIRFGYMDTVSSLYSKCFTEKLGSWCREHGVMYIGHVIEDNSSDLSLSSSTGHYFRSLDSQDMSGIDIVLNQWNPGALDIDYRYAGGNRIARSADFRYQLGKMASSHSHIDPKKKNRAMCEIFGAFGWGEGIPMMKKMADSMLVSGINRFVPHAFTPKENDTDCPPHFYDKGKFTQYPYFGKLISYMIRVSHILSNGVHQADCLLYYSTGAWTGDEIIQNDFYARSIIQSGLDFDFITEDYIGSCSVSNKHICCNNERYKCIYVPYSKVIDSKASDQLVVFAQKDIPVIFFHDLPASDEKGNIPSVCNYRNLVHVTEPDEENILSFCRSEIDLSENFSHVRHYMVNYSDRRVCMFVNEDENLSADFYIRNFSLQSVIYSPIENKLFKPDICEKGIHLIIDPGCSVIVIENIESGFEYITGYLDTIIKCKNDSFRIPVSECSVQYKFDSAEEWIDSKSLSTDILDTAKYISYEFSCPKFTGENTYILFDHVGEIATVYINGNKEADIICCPYSADISGKLCNQVNKIRIEVICNIGYDQRDWFTSFLTLPVSGLTGSIHIKSTET